MIEVNQAQARVRRSLETTFGTEQGVPQLLGERGGVRTFIQPFQHFAAVDGDGMGGIVRGCQGVEGFEERLKNLVGTLLLISRRAVKIDLEDAPALQLSFTLALLGGDEIAADFPRKVLQERSLAVASVAEEHDQIHVPCLNILLECPIQPGFHIGLHGKLRIQASRLCIAVARARIGAKQVAEPGDDLRAQGGERRCRHWAGCVGLEVCGQKRQRVTRIHEASLRVGMSSAVQECPQLRHVDGVASRPVETLILAARSPKQEGLLIKNNMEEGRGKCEQIIAGRDAGACFHRFTCIPGMVGARHTALICHGVVVGQHHIAACHDDVARADIAMYQPHLMQLPKRLTQVSDPAQDQRLDRWLRQFFPVQFKHSRQVMKRDPFNPFQQCGKSVPLP